MSHKHRQRRKQMNKKQQQAIEPKTDDICTSTAGFTFAASNYAPNIYSTERQKELDGLYVQLDVLLGHIQEFSDHTDLDILVDMDTMSAAYVSNLQKKKKTLTLKTFNGFSDEIRLLKAINQYLAEEIASYYMSA